MIYGYYAFYAQEIVISFYNRVTNEKAVACVKEISCSGSFFGRFAD